MFVLTGASGFIGSSLCREIEETFINFGRVDVPNAINYRVKFEKEDVFLPKLNHRVESFVNLMGYAHKPVKSVSEVRMERILNFNAVLKMMDFCVRNSIKHFVHVSSIAVYGDFGENLSEDVACMPKSVYGRTKLDCELAIKEFCSNNDLHYTILRPTAVYGAGCPGNYRLIHNYIKKNLPIFVGKRSNKRSIIHLSDFTSLIIDILNKPEIYKNMVLNVSDGASYSTEQIFDYLIKSTNSYALKIKLKDEILQMPFKLTRTYNVYRKIYGDFHVNTELLFNKTPWRPKHSFCS